ncbi:hypothetical protein CDAR_259661 [Caerostris darwini]|uniref:Uncharacterized protein n=1 Tax=Caerostris darwini TaxID=1538125 RepID=A0AAV4VN61_9ARAC|nr:hypothetical protein CDAR_259661 [Caerostris darwini]
MELKLQENVEGNLKNFTTMSTFKQLKTYQWERDIVSTFTLPFLLKNGHIILPYLIGQNTANEGSQHHADSSVSS